MMIKYRVSDVAKDFGVPGKEIIELLEKHFTPAKKSASALEENELDIIFEHYTQKFAVDNLDAYFATANERPVKKPEPKPEPKAEPKVEPKAEPKVEPKAEKPAAPAQKGQRRSRHAGPDDHLGKAVPAGVKVADKLHRLVQKDAGNRHIQVLFAAGVQPQGGNGPGGQAEQIAAVVLGLGKHPLFLAEILAGGRV